MLPTSHDDTRALSGRQRSILTLLASGLLSVDASNVLQIPVDELRADVRDIIRTLGAGSKLEAVIVALRRGLIRLPDDDRDDHGKVPA